MEEKKTHRLVAKPQMSIRYLADYMAASDQVRRTVLRDCKFRAIAKIVQHDEAKLAVASHLLSGGGDPNKLQAQAEYIRNKLADDQFDRDCNDHNADYVERFSKVVEAVTLPKGAMWTSSSRLAPINVNGVKVTFLPSLLVTRVTAKNTVKRGALTLRYAKGKALSVRTAEFQSSAIHGVLCMHGTKDGEEIDRALCFTLDAYSGKLHPAPSDAVSRFNNTKAACAMIADAWDNIQPPAGAVL